MSMRSHIEKKSGPKTLTDTSPNGIQTGKDAPHHMQQGKCKLKQQGNIIARLLEGPKPGTLIAPNDGEGVEQQELSFVAAGNAKWYSQLQDNWTVSYKTTHSLILEKCHHALWYSLK